MIQKNFLRFLITLFYFFISTTAYSYSFVSEGIYYNILSDDTTVEVTYRNTNYDTYIGDISIPSEVSYNGKTYTVTGIGDRAFYECSTVTSITIPSSINKIGIYAFEYANHIQKVNISNLSSWCMIDIHSFYSCPLVYGGTLYLNNSPVTSLESLDSSCTTIAKYAFYGNTYLTNIVLPESIKSVQEGAFRRCTNLKYFEVGPNVTSMGEGVFISCTSLETIKFCDSDQGLMLESYMNNYLYPYFRDCPLTTVYIGRKINWKDDSLNHEYYYPFTSVKTAVFNVAQTSDSGFSDSLTTAYIGNKCQELSLRSKNLSDLFIFTNNITRAYLTCKKTNIYIIDKTNIPSKISELSYQSINNLVDTQNLQNGASYIYGNTPKFDLNNFSNNVAGMSLYISSSSIYTSVGFHDIGIPVTLSNNLWNIEYNLPYSYTVTPAILTVIANDSSRKYGMENPELTCSFFGFKNGETKEVLTRLPNVETTATISSNVGTYPIIPSGAEAQNYTFNYERGTLTITKADQKIEWEQQFGTVNVGDVIELTATSSAGLPVKYTSTDESIAEIFTQGGKKFVEFLKSGVVNIRATQEGNENYNEADRISKNVRVGSLISSITLNETSVTLNEGESLQLTTNITPSTASNKSIAWESSNTEIATVDSNGKVTAIKQGSTTITVKSTDGSNVSASCNVTVTKPVSNIVLSETEITLNEGQSAKLTATVSPELANNKTIAWSSSNDNVAIVDQNGKVTAISKGSAIITAKATDGSNISASCIVNVVKPISSIVLNETEITLNEGQSTKLTATVSPENANNKPIAWSSSNDNVAIVDQNGKVTAISKGFTIITAKATDGSNISASCIVNVVKPVSSIVLSETEITLNEGQSAKLTATVSPENANNKTIVWASNNDNIATVDQNCKVTAISKGTAVITARSTDGSNISASCTVNVIKLVSGIALSETEMTLNEGQSAKLTATVSPELANNKTIAWSSSNNNVAIVDQNGKVTAISKGSAIITAKTTDGSNISATCTVNVVKPVSSIVLSETEMTLNEGQSAKLTVTVSPENANNKTIAWSSSNNNVATVDQDGKVTAISKGTAVITARATDGSNISASCTVKVIKLVSSIVLSETEMTLNEGQSAKLTATVSPELANNKTIAWSSSNENVATVDQNGKVTAISKGTAVITARSTDGSNISASCIVNVIKLVSGIVLSETEITLNEGATAQLNAIVSDANNTNIIWFSSNETIATVNQDGKVTAIAKGTAIITAKATDGSNISASCTVNVIKLVSNITLSATNITLNEGESVTLTATISPSTANNKTIAWTSSNESVASVNENGIITAHIQGNAIITATSTDGSNKTASCVVTVIKPVSSIYISHKKINMTIGEKTTLIAYALPLDATNTTLNWYSTDESVVKVEDGVIYAIGSGSAFIIVESTDGSNIMEKCEIIVTKQSGIDVTSSDEVRVYVSNGQIIIDNVPFDHIAYVFHTNGTLMKKETSIGNTIIVQPETNGIYIVVVDSRSYKVLLR